MEHSESTVVELMTSFQMSIEIADEHTLVTPGHGSTNRTRTDATTSTRQDTLNQLLTRHALGARLNAVSSHAGEGVAQ